MLGYTNCSPCDDGSVFDRALGAIFARVKYSPYMGLLGTPTLPHVMMTVCLMGLVRLYL